MEHITAFNDLPWAERTALLAEFGVYIESINFYDYKVHLHTIGNNYVELWYNYVTRETEKLLMIEYKALDKYLPYITFNSMYLNR